MDKLFKFILAISSTSLLPIIYLIKSRCYILETDLYNYIDNKETIEYFKNISLLGYFIIPFLLVFSVLFLIRFLEKDEVREGDIIDFEDSSNNFLPSYLGYFFVALSISDKDFFILFVIFSILIIFVYFSQVNYFNPLFLVLGYKFYKIRTEKGITLLLISKGEFRKTSDIKLDLVYRINDFTFINK